MKLRFTPRATRDLSEIADYLRERSPAASVRVRASILDALTNALAFPSLGRLQRERGVRKLVTSRFGYLIYYLVDEQGDALVVLTVQHPAQERRHEDL